MSYTPPDGSLLAFWLTGNGYAAPNGAKVAFDLVFYPPYVPPAGNLVPLEFGEDDAYTPPAGNEVGLEFVIDADTPPAASQYIFPVAVAAAPFGAPSVRNQREFIRPTGLTQWAFGVPALRNNTTIARPPSVVGTGYGTATVRNKTQVIKPTPINPGAIPNTHTLILKNRRLYPAGIDGSAFSSPPLKIYNLRQYLRPNGASASIYGTAFVQGGVKTVRPSTIAPIAPSSPTVVNTKATQTAVLVGIASLAMGSYKVSPQTLRPFGFVGVVGIPGVQRNPSPAGFVALSWGTPWVYFKNRTITFAGISSFETGFPKIADRAQRVYHTASPVSTVFGDIAVDLKNSRTQPAGFDSFATSIFHEIRSTRRFLLAGSISAPPVGQAVAHNKTPNLSPAGIDSQQFGRLGYLVVGYRVRVLLPSGIASPFQAVPSPSLWQTPSLKPAGISAPSVSQPTIWPAVRTVFGAGADMQRFGGIEVNFRYRILAVEGNGINATRWGQHRIEHSLRYVTFLGDVQSRYGTPWASYGRRFIDPEGIPVNGIPRHLVGGTRWITPPGFDSQRFGTRIIPESQTVFPLGFAEIYGLTYVKNRKAFVTPPSVLPSPQPEQSWGTARVVNSRQYIVQTFDSNSALTPPEWSHFQSIANRNRIVGAIGAAPLTPSKPQIDNSARQILPLGADAPAYAITTKEGMVAFRIRPLQLEAIEEPPILRWSAVYNKAFPLKPAGFRGQEFGLATIFSNRRFFKYIGAFDASEYGTPFVAFRVRTIPMELRYSIGAPVIPLPLIKLHSRYVEPVGSSMLGVGLPNAVIHFTIIAPRWPLRDAYGVPRLHNVTPELRTKGRGSEEFGETLIRLQWRPLKAEGSLMQLFGKPKIADRKQSIIVAGRDLLTVSDKLKVIKTGAPPYSPQYIIQDGTEIDSEVQIGKPGLNQAVIYVDSGNNMAAFGTAFVRTNVLRIEAGIVDTGYGEPFITLKRRFLDLEGKGWKTSVEPSPARVSPHTIWAVKEAPEQAKTNNPGGRLHYVGETDVYPPGERFGMARVSINRDKIENASSGEFARFGFPSFQLRKRIITPKSISQSRIGVHSLSDGLQKVRAFGSHDSQDFGSAVVIRGKYLGPQTVRGTGIAPPPISATHWASLFKRSFQMSGFNALRLGDSRGESPYQWQSLHVGPPMPTKPVGSAMDLHGMAWISHRVREVVPQGFVAFRSEYQLEMFAARMRVRNTAPQVPIPPAQSIIPVGVDVPGLGVPNVRLKTHYILPDGNADQHRKGAW